MLNHMPREVFNGLYMGLRVSFEPQNKYPESARLNAPRNRLRQGLIRTT